MNVFERELDVRAKRVLERFDEDYAVLRRRLIEHQGGAVIPEQCDSFDWFVADTAFRMRQIAACRTLFLEMVARLSEIHRIDQPAKRESALLGFSADYQELFRVPTVYVDMIGDKSVVDNAYRRAIRIYQEAILEESIATKKESGNG